MPAYIIYDQRLPCGWTLTCQVSVGKHARPWRLCCCSCHHTDRRSSYPVITLSILQTVSPRCCMFSLFLFLLMNVQFSVNSTIMLLTALHYASICSYASTLLLCSKLCQHNSPRPTHYYIQGWGAWPHSIIFWQLLDNGLNQSYLACGLLCVKQAVS